MMDCNPRNSELRYIIQPIARAISQLKSEHKIARVAVKNLSRASNMKHSYFHDHFDPVSHVLVIPTRLIIPYQSEYLTSNLM